MKVLRVACAVIEQGGNVLVARRGENMKHPLMWEFPGGKVEEGESAEECVVREIQEELKMEVEVKSALPVCIETQQNQVLHLMPFVCSIIQGNPEALVHNKIAWSKPEALHLFNWIPIDLKVIEYYLNYIKK